MALYDTLGTGYGLRRADPRIAARIDAALGDARSVLNVGAGTGNYEPTGRDVIALDPSRVMLEQRPPGAAPAVLGVAEALPFAPSSFDAAMAVLSDHHWPDRAAGYRELRRVARGPVVIFNWEPEYSQHFWLTRDYLPGFDRLGSGVSRAALIREAIGPIEVEPVPVPADCLDGFYHAFWRRPEAYLDPAVRGAISVFSRLDALEVERAMETLTAHLASGEWHRRNQEILALDEMDLGYRLFVSTSPTAPGEATLALR